MAQNVTLIDIPKLPTCIHLDTLFTQISHKDFVYYQPFLGDDRPIRIEQFRGSLNDAKSYGSLGELLKELVPDVQLIPCGNGMYPYQEREQYASGCNFVSLKDGVAISYARNIKTLDALKQYGYKIVTAKNCWSNYKTNLYRRKRYRKWLLPFPHRS